MATDELAFEAMNWSDFVIEVGADAALGFADADWAAYVVKLEVE